MPIAVIASNYELPTKNFIRYRRAKYARFGLTYTTSGRIAARVRYRNYNTYGESINTVTVGLVYRF